MAYRDNQTLIAYNWIFELVEDVVSTTEPGSMNRLKFPKRRMRARISETPITILSFGPEYSAALLPSASRETDGNRAPRNRVRTCDRRMEPERHSGYC